LKVGGIGRLKEREEGEAVKEDIEGGRGEMERPN